MNKMPESISEIVNHIELTLRRTDIPVDDIAGSIVAVTLGNNSIEVRDYFDELPELHTVAELAADLELTEAHVRPYPQWNELLEEFEKLKKRLEDTPQLGI